MIWMQDVAYTDYIYWQETNSFINGVASSSQNIELFFDKKVDRDSSLVIYDGKQVDLSHDHIYIDVQKEGVTQLVYILKDVDGYALEQGEKSILLDTTIPDIVVKVKNHNIMDVLPLENKETIHVEILEENLKMCEKATEFLFAYTENLLNIDEEDLVKKELQEKYKKYFEITKHVSYDLWEMNEGVHLYTLSCIISGLECMKKIYETIDNKQENLRLKQEKRNKIALKLNKYIQLLKDYIEDNLIDKNTKTLKRNLKDNNMDISVIGAVYPFNVFNPNEKVIKNTVDKINMTLRTHTSGYLRFEYDNYMGGNNPWKITTL